MSITANAQWFVRAGGNAANGGGWDDTIAGAGTNYADQNSAQVSLSDLATPSAGSTTLTSATGGFTAAMIGNCVRIASGTNFQAGYYFVVGYTNGNTVTVDRTPTSGAAGSGGVGRLGGAFASVSSVATSASPSSPLASGHRVWICGAGSDYPTAADFTSASYYSYAAGVRFIGYNGRPRIDVGGLFSYSSDVAWENCYFKLTGASSPDFGVLHSARSVYGCYFDAAGNDIIGVLSAASVIECAFTNSGSTSAGSRPAVRDGAYGNIVTRNVISKWRGGGIVYPGSNGGAICDNVVTSTGAVGIQIDTAVLGFRTLVAKNTVIFNASDGVKVTHADAQWLVRIEDCIIAFNGGYGVNFSGASGASREVSPIERNVIFSNSSGSASNTTLSATNRSFHPGVSAASWSPISSPSRARIGGDAESSTIDPGAVQLSARRVPRTRVVRG